MYFNFDTSQLGEIARTSALAKANLKLLKQRLLKDFESPTPNYDVLYRTFQAHQLLNGSPVEANTTLGEALSLVNSGVQQENINLTRVKEIIGGKEGLLTMGRLVLPLWATRYSHGGLDSQNRHRLYALGAIAKAIKGGVAKTHPEQVEAFDAYLADQKMAILELSFGFDEAYRKWYKSIKNTPELVDVTDALSRQLDGVVTLHFNGSRTPSAGEKNMVKISSLGVDPKNPSSILAGLSKGFLTSKDAFCLLVLNASYEAGSGHHSLRIMPGCMETTDGIYSRLSPEGLKKAIETLYGVVAKFPVEGKDGNCRLRRFVQGSWDLIPKVKKEKFTTPSFNASKHSLSPNLLSDTITALVLEQRAVDEWADMLGNSEVFDWGAIPSDQELSFFELCWQILWVTTTSYVGNIGQSAGTSKKTDPQEWKLGNVIQHLLELCDDEDQLEGNLFPEDEDEEVEAEAQESDSESESGEDEDDLEDFDFDA